MPVQSQLPRVLRFGNFEIDVRAGELRKNGVKLKLQEQPFQLLCMLVEHPGEVVTREELRNRLWPADTFVDFDHGVNAAVKRLRDALGESADAPVFIETLSRRGYKFIAPVDGASRSEVLPTGRADAKALRRVLLIGTVILISLAFAAASWWLQSRRVPRITALTRLSFAGRAAAPTPLLGYLFPALATDGSRIYYSAFQENTLRLAYASVTGGDHVSMTTPLGYAEARHISPDGSLLLVYGSTEGHLGTQIEGHLWLVPTAGGGPRRLVNIDGHDGAWSPDGRRIVFANGQDLHIADSNGSNSRKLTTLPGKPFWIRWAPDSARIRFTVIDTKTSVQTLWECSAEGKDLHRVPLSADKQAQECCGEWTPDGKYFLFRNFQDGRADIWLIFDRPSPFWRQSQKPVRLTAGPLNSAAAIPSRDGKKLFAVEVIPKSELYKYDLKTRRLAPFLPGISAVTADFSPDRQWAVYVEARGKEFILWRSKLDGSERLQLTTPPLLVLDPRWSPDGRQIVFMGKMPDGVWDNYLVPAIGDSPRPLPSSVRNAVDATWSPDGNSIIFGRPPDFLAEDSTPKAIYLLNLTSNQLTTLPGSEGLFSPRWSPDGRYVAAMPLDMRKLLLFDFAAQRWTALITNHCVDGPLWSRDTAYIYFNGCNNTVMRVGRVSSKLEQVLDFTAAVPNALGCGLVNTIWDDAVLITCGVNDSELYALDLELP